MISPTSIPGPGDTGAKRTGERGQISIFFASSLIILISIIAFIINIGLFVKAKINLQNATDAAAYAGAAVQSRMLTKIGYLNWEMRNVYKEWMFKYYVLGNLNIANVENPSTIGDRVSFRMLPDPNVASNLNNTDIYNFPSVCLHYSGVPTNVCRRYALPGIPRFEPTNLVGIDQTTSSFIDAIVREKSDDCSKRSRLNFNVTNMWAYQVVDRENGSGTSAFADAPQIAADRPGAWPQAVELAMRTRNLEFAMNLPPIQGICAAPGAAAGNCARQIGELSTTRHYGHERPVKAFYSGFRNLGSDSDTEMRESFTLTELSPTPYISGTLYDTSTTLMPSSQQSTPKYYLDLKIMMVNYATFFTALIAGDNSIRVSGTRVNTEGSCDVSKIAIPVPGYPLGFYKNPEILTYYAVRGQSRFVGLFNPFAGNGVVMTAYAAAKPMGGRIGPALFMQRSSSDPTLLISRTDRPRSTSYISGLDLSNLPRKGSTGTVPLGQYASGMPVPINTSNDTSGRFWIGDPTDNVGGWLPGPEIVFGIPNLTYDFVGSNFVSQDSGSRTSIITPATPNSDAVYGNGLYRKEQFESFRSNLIGTDTPDEIVGSILRARAPTRYEIANYSIPTATDLHLSQQIDGFLSDNFGSASGKIDAQAGVDVRRFSFYAPLFGTSGDVLFRGPQDVVATIGEYIKQQEPAMRKYRNSLNRVAQSIFAQNPTEYAPAANRISNINFSESADTANPTNCDSIAGQFLYYYFGGEDTSLGPPQGTTGCPRSLRQSLEAYYGGSLGTFNRYMYQMEMTMPLFRGMKFSDPLTGYMPGPLRGANDLGQFGAPFPTSTDKETMRRSGYSTKFVTLRSVTRARPGYSDLAIYSEGRPGPINDIKADNFRNALDASALNIPSTITH